MIGCTATLGCMLQRGDHVQVHDVELPAALHCRELPQAGRIISNTSGLPSNLPVVVFILAVDGVLAIIEDRRRHLADKEAKLAQCHVLKQTFTGPEGIRACIPLLR
ncbi:hypothetical protein PF002_g2496 [Phytophthora fragariae]|uniref:Uncharacterized protein n=2 Tax=Phytophthora fragariae TaxID=53985 RepID=A0A6A3MFT6_9STRA|nr:hypothetical protein PF003_g18736 [Phytophthora fragariae]KAE8948024.1 hypothetical protein PF009_g2399 [Phytophthora fragariae]KAE9027434.1 hypothetical protein PF011_g2044 [Phytophthora fragariae]KAE9136508.1 hypothetical protein PF007_g2170 [Phytophthora fragariae]KAE9153659.1 hypothetical protein PF006_g2236 [Phytophthora fragariae]